MNSQSNFLPRFTVGLTYLAPLLFSFLLVGCNYSGVKSLVGIEEKPLEISLEIPQGYEPAKLASETEKSWEEVADNAQKMAFSGPPQEEVTPEAIVREPIKEKPVLKSKAPKLIAKKLTRGKKLAQNTGRFWKPAKVAMKKTGV